jgi:signal transduction histidine kinase
MAELIRNLADESGLILDSNLTRYHLIFATINTLPSIYFKAKINSAKNQNSILYLDDNFKVLKRSIVKSEAPPFIQDKISHLELKIQNNEVSVSNANKEILLLGKEMIFLVRGLLDKELLSLNAFQILSLCFSVFAILISIFIHRYMVRTTYKSYKQFIADLRGKEQQIIAMKHTAEATSKMATLGEMTSEIAHEINNPLSVIYSKADLMKSNFANGETISNEQMQDFLSKIVIYSGRISKIVKSMKTMARDGSQDPMELVSINDIIDSSSDLCLDKMQKHKILFECYCPADLFVKCRSIEISQIIINLLNNAIDAIKNSTTPWIRLSTDMHEQKILIRVVDSGLGVPKELEDKIMQPFFTTKKVGEGTGLGLSISNKIATAHGGRLYIDRQNSDSCFCLELPIFND